MRLNECHMAAVPLDPMISLMFLVRKYRRGRLLLQTRRNSQTARSGTDNQHIKDIKKIRTKRSVLCRRHFSCIV